MAVGANTYTYLINIMPNQYPGHGEHTARLPQFGWSVPGFTGGWAEIVWNEMPSALNQVTAVAVGFDCTSPALPSDTLDLPLALQTT